MFAIVDIAGQQFKVENNQRVFVHRLEAMEGTQVEFNRVLLLDNDGKITVGKPLVEGYRVAAKVLAHVKGEKVIVFKKKRRKGYAKKNGHRQQFSQILIQGILAPGETVKEEAKPEKKEEAAGEEKAVKAKAKKPAAKKAPAKKTAAPKKTTRKKSE
jgi:large subunit ribosomal protein L21